MAKPICARCGKDIRGEPVTFTVDGRVLHYHPKHAPAKAPAADTELDRFVKTATSRFVIILLVPLAKMTRRDLETGRSRERVAGSYPTLEPARESIGARAWAEREIADGYAESAVIVDKNLGHGARGVVWRSEAEPA